MRLGRRQLDVLLAADAGKASLHHHLRGAMQIFGASEVYPGDVVDGLLEHDLVYLEDHPVRPWQLIRATLKGTLELERRGATSYSREGERA